MTQYRNSLRGITKTIVNSLIVHAELNDPDCRLPTRSTSSANLRASFSLMALTYRGKYGVPSGITGKLIDN